MRIFGRAWGKVAGKKRKKTIIAEVSRDAPTRSGQAENTEEHRVRGEEVDSRQFKVEREKQTRRAG